MSNSTASGSPKRAVLAALVILAGACAASSIYHGRAAVKAWREKDEATRRLAEDNALARRFRRASDSALAISSNITEARSIEFLNTALRRNGIPPAIDPGDPKEAGDQFDKIETKVTLENVDLSSVVNFLRQVQAQRPNLSLLRLSITRKEGAQDVWDADVTFGALIPARSRR